MKIPESAVTAAFGDFIRFRSKKKKAVTRR